MNLKSKSDQELLRVLKLQVESERKLLMEILYSLQEVEARQLHLEMGYPDLYTFAMKELGYSSGSTYRRISAMRLLKSVPEVATRLESGELGLENASQAQSFFRKQDQARKEQGQKKLTLDEKREVVSELLGKSTREGLRVLTERTPDIMIPKEKLRPLPEQKTMVQFVASPVLMEKLEELKHLFAHKNFEGRMDVLIEQLADIALSKLKPKTASKPVSHSRAEPLHDGVSGHKTLSLPSHPTNSSPALGTDRNDKTLAAHEPALETKQRSRYISAEVKRRVILKKQNGCGYKDPKTGRVCQSKHGLQFDHIFPFSQGGSSSASNLQLLCGAHNRYRAFKAGLSH